MRPTKKSHRRWGREGEGNQNSVERKERQRGEEVQRKRGATDLEILAGRTVCGCLEGWRGREKGKRGKGIRTRGNMFSQTIFEHPNISLSHPNVPPNQNDPPCRIGVILSPLFSFLLSSVRQGGYIYFFAPLLLPGSIPSPPFHSSTIAGVHVHKHPPCFPWTT